MIFGSASGKRCIAMMLSVRTKTVLSSSASSMVTCDDCSFPLVVLIITLFDFFLTPLASVDSSCFLTEDRVFLRRYSGGATEPCDSFISLDKDDGNDEVCVTSNTVTGCTADSSS